MLLSNFDVIELWKQKQSVENVKKNFLLKKESLKIQENMSIVTTNSTDFVK